MISLRVSLFFPSFERAHNRQAIGGKLSMSFSVSVMRRSGVVTGVLECSPF